jgi:hypothetical protein
MLSFLTALILTFATQATATEDSCYNKITAHNICEEAVQLRQEIASNLPQQLSQNLLWRSVSSQKNIITGHVMLLYTKDFLEKAVVSGGRTMSTIEQQMIQMTQTMVCSMPHTSAFINHGGVLQYHYMFETGEFYLQASVNAC